MTKRANRIGSYSSFEGFDGDTLYYAEVISRGLNSSKKTNQEKNQDYTTIIFLKKAGNKKDLKNYCDLKKFLMQNSFIEIK